MLSDLWSLWSFNIFNPVHLHRSASSRNGKIALMMSSSCLSAQREASFALHLPASKEYGPTCCRSEPPNCWNIQSWSITKSEIGFYMVFIIIFSNKIVQMQHVVGYIPTISPLYPHYILIIYIYTVINTYKYIYIYTYYVYTYVYIYIHNIIYIYIYNIVLYIYIYTHPHVWFLNSRVSSAEDHPLSFLHWAGGCPMGCGWCEIRLQWTQIFC